MRSLTRLLLAIYAATFALACGNDSTSGDRPNAGVRDTGVDTRATDARDAGSVIDTADAPLGSQAGFGEECEADRECASRFCIVTMEFDQGLCTRFCSDDSGCEEEGWSCVFLLNSGGDGARICVPTDLCIDEDNDGYGRGPSCEGPDCDDDDPEVYAGADERCNGLDDDCDGAFDEFVVDTGEACSTAFPGECSRGITNCELGFSECRSLAPASLEICNALDDDCDGETDEQDDGAPLSEQCYPAAPETAGIGSCAAGIRSCAGGTFSQCEGLVLPSLEFCNGLDDDCDGETDEGDPGGGFECNTGLDGACAPGVRRCEGSRVECAGLVAPGDHEELCNGLDDDCDGEVDEDSRWTTRGAGCTDGVGLCLAAGILVCDPDDPSGELVCSAEPRSGAVEVCNGLDDDCDGIADDGALWSERGNVCFDGVGACRRAGILICDVDGAAGPLECTATADPEAPEVCNGLDDDCDGLVDDLESELCPLQLGVCAGAAQICAGGGGFLECTTLNYGLDYELIEISCDGLDNDCDGEVDDVDVDRDGFVDVDCGGTDCDDLSPLVNPEALEVCGDLVDNDCNDIAEDKDVDEDGAIDVACGGDDCNDRSALARPGLDEVCGDRLDNDCDGSADNKDIDGDSFLDPACGGTDCDDDESRAFPGNPEVCDLVDNDCSDVVDDKDTDGDGYIDDDPVCGGDDCDDDDIFVNPGADEMCGDLVDDDCSGATDDRDIDGDGFFDDDPACGGDDCKDSLDTVFPDAPEIRDGEDNDCNLLWDEGLILPGELIVTEAMPNPSAVSDSFGEWLEVFNTTDIPINLNSFRLHDDGEDSWLVLDVEGVNIGPREYVTLCRNGLFSFNGGVVCDSTYDDFILANGPDEIVLSLGDVEIDRVNYDGSFPWTSDTTMSLRTDALDSVSNDLAASWCPTAPTAENQLAGGDYGTPRRAADCR